MKKSETDEGEKERVYDRKWGILSSVGGFCRSAVSALSLP